MVPVQAEFEVTTDQNQDQQRPLKIVLDPTAARARLALDLRILSADLFAHGTGAQDLGRHCALTLLTLTHEVMQRREGIEDWQLAEATGLTVRTVARHLRALQECDLVDYSARDGGWYSTGVDAAEVDQGEGEGTGARRAERHRIDALVWGWWKFELEWLRMTRLEKVLDARRGRRRQPYGQQALGPVDIEMFRHLRYPRREASIQYQDGRTVIELVPDHAEAAAIVRHRIREAEGSPALPAPTAPSPSAVPGAWTGDTQYAPDFVTAAAAGEPGSLAEAAA